MDGGGVFGNRGVACFKKRVAGGGGRVFWGAEGKGGEKCGEKTKWNKKGVKEGSKFGERVAGQLPGTMLLGSFSRSL